MTEGAAVSETTPNPARNVRVHAVLKSDTGLVRTENQDYALMSTPAEETSATGRLLVVADGMGGHRGGATASRLAGETIREFYLHGEGEDIPGALREAFRQANARIFHEAASNPELRGMGTTCSALVVRDATGYIAHVGDSRIYRYRNGTVDQLTQDHSLVASMVREGLLTSKEAEVHPRRNVLQRSMGVSEDVEVDVLEPFPVEVGDVFVLCSDGLHGLVREPELGEVIEANGVERSVQELVRRALERGAPDNVSVIVAKIEDPAHSEEKDPTAGDVDTDKIRVAALNAEAQKRSGNWFLVLLILVGIAALVFYALGYRFDPALLRKFLGTG